MRLCLYLYIRRGEREVYSNYKPTIICCYKVCLTKNINYELYTLIEIQSFVSLGHAYTYTDIIGE